MRRNVGGSLQLLRLLRPLWRRPELRLRHDMHLPEHHRVMLGAPLTLVVLAAPLTILVGLAQAGTG